MDLPKLAWNLCALVCLLATTAQAAEYTLFTGPRQFASNYNSIVQNLQPGDVVKFSDGTSFTVERIIGAGSNTRVIAVNGGQALRIPIRALAVYQHVLDDFHEGHTSLSEARVPTVGIRSNRAGEYVAVDRINDGMTFDAFVRQQSTMDGEQRTRMWNSFVEFARATAPLSSIGDFKRDGLMYSEATGWRLVDWQSHNFPIDYSNSPTVFDDREFRGHIPAEIRERIQAAIAAERATAGFAERVPIFRRCFSWILGRW